MSAHAKLSPSAADRWAACPASIRLSAGMPDVPSSYAQEGTAAHAVLERALRAGSLTRESCAGDDELFDALAVAVDAVAALRADFSALDFIDYEVRVTPFRQREDTRGTADIAMAGMLRDGRTAVLVADYKHGKNVAVGASSAQLMLYALGVANAVGGFIDTFITVVIQPRLAVGTQRVKRHEHDRAAMIEFSRRMLAAAKATEAPDAPAIAGLHCRWCLAKPVCPAHAEQRIRSDEKDFAAFL
jgi:hypothetical protein